MVATRTRTASLPAKKATLAEEQAAAAHVKKSQRVSKPRDKAPKPPVKKKSKAVDQSDSKTPTTIQEIPQESSPPKEVSAPQKKKGKASKAKTQPPSTSTRISVLPHFHREGATGFLDLPAELRNEIYCYVINDYVSDDEFVATNTEKPYIDEPTLLGVNRQVRAETMGLFYGDNIFQIEGSSMAVKVLRSMDDEKLRALRALYIRTNFRQPTKELIVRLQQLMRQFKPRGLRRTVLHMMVGEGDDEEWMTLPELLRLQDER